MNIRTGDPEMAREINRALILDLLRKHDSIPRAQIARLLDLSKVTVSAVVSQLIEDEFVIELGEGNALKRGGRKPIPPFRIPSTVSSGKKPCPDARASRSWATSA